MTRIRPDDRGRPSDGVATGLILDAQEPGLLNTACTIRPDQCRIYGPFLDFLNARLANDHEIITFPYDWRADLRLESPRLARAIADALNATGFDRVDIVAHSMGGLLVKDLLSQVDGNGHKIRELLVRRLVFIGTPHFGAPLGLRSIFDGVPVVDPLQTIIQGSPLELFPIKFRTSPTKLEVLAYAARNMPAVHQLFPSQRYLQTVGLPLSLRQPLVVDAENFNSTPKVISYNDVAAEDFGTLTAFIKQHAWRHTLCTDCPPIRLDSCGSFTEFANRNLDEWVSPHGRVLRSAGWDAWKPDDSGLDAYAIYGETARARTLRHMTIGEILGRGVVLDYEEGRGDGTVPSDSALGGPYFAPSSRHLRVGADHLGLMKDSAVMACVESRLRNSPGACSAGLIARAAQVGEDADIEIRLEGDDLVSQVQDEMQRITGLNADGLVTYAIPDSTFDFLGVGQRIVVPEQSFVARVTKETAGPLYLRLRRLIDGQVRRELHYEVDLQAGGRVSLRFDPANASPVMEVDLDGDGTNETPVDAAEFPLADAGDDVTVAKGGLVRLDGSRSSAPGEGVLVYRWIQQEGPVVRLDNPHSASPTFTAPDVEQDTTLVFALQTMVGDISGRPDSVAVLVRACGLETCNGLDDDCDDQVDEEDPGGGSACTPGTSEECRTGVLHCIGGTVACLPTNEDCALTGCRNDADCDDEIFCNGPESCVGAALCVTAAPPCSEFCQQCDEPSKQCALIRDCVSPTPTNTRTATPSVTPSPSPTPTVTATPSPTLTHTATPSVTPLPSPTATPTPCDGDCDGVGGVTHADLAALLGLALRGDAPASLCPSGDSDDSGAITIEELVGAVLRTRQGCL